MTDKLDEILEYLFSEALLFGEPRPHEKKEIVTQAKLELVRWVQGHREELMKTLLDSVYKEEVFNSALDTLSDEILPNWRKE